MYILFICMYFSTASSNIFILIFRYRVFIHWIMLNGYILYFRSPTEPPPGKEPCVNSWGFYSLLPTMGLLWTEFGFKVTNLSTLFFNFLSFGPRKAVETAFQKLIKTFQSLFHTWWTACTPLRPESETLLSPNPPLPFLDLPCESKGTWRFPDGLMWIGSMISLIDLI